MSNIDVNIQDLSALLSCAKMYMDEATIKISNGYAEIVEVDPTHTQMLHGRVKCDSEPCEISVGLEKIIKAISAAGKDCTLELTDSQLILHGAHSRIKVPLIIRDSKFKWPAKFTGEPVATCDISPSLLAPSLSYGIYTNSVAARFKIADTRMTIEMGQAPDITELQSPSTAVGECAVNIDLAYLDTLIKYVKAVPTITVCGYGDNVPLMFRWTDGTGEYKVLVAPRIEEGE